MLQVGLIDVCKPSGDFNCIVNSTLLSVIVLYPSNFLVELYNFDEGYVILAEKLMLAIIGEWSDYKSKFGAMFVYAVDIPSVTKSLIMDPVI